MQTGCTAKPSMQPASMLRHQYHISAESYDVATNLKWALWSAKLSVDFAKLAAKNRNARGAVYFKQASPLHTAMVRRHLP